MKIMSNIYIYNKYDLFEFYLFLLFLSDIKFSFILILFNSNINNHRDNQLI